MSIKLMQNKANVFSCCSAKEIAVTELSTHFNS